MREAVERTHNVQRSGCSSPGDTAVLIVLAQAHGRDRPAVQILAVGAEEQFDDRIGAADAGLGNGVVLGVGLPALADAVLAVGVNGRRGGIRRKMGTKGGRTAKSSLRRRSRITSRSSRVSSRPPPSRSSSRLGLARSTVYSRNGI